MFKGRQFDPSVILLCVRWYLAYNLSLRNLEEMMAERASPSITPPSVAGSSVTHQSFSSG
jgi:transposase-like protein